MSTTKVTFTTLNRATGRLTATFETDDGQGNVTTTSPDFSEEDLRAQAAKADPPRTDWNIDDVVALGEAALASASQPAPQPEPEQPPAGEQQPEA